jgi:hypothetical protein
VGKTLQLAYPGQPDAVVVQDIAKRIRLAIEWVTAATEEDRNAAALEGQLTTAVRHASNGAFDLAEAALTDIEAELETAAVTMEQRARLSSAVAEARAWNALARGDRMTAVAQFVEAVGRLRIPVQPSREHVRRTADLYYFAGAADTSEVGRYFARSVQTMEILPPRGRGAGGWLRMSAALYALGHFTEAYSAADAARRLAAWNPELGVLLFQSAFNARNDRVAAAECRTINKRLAGSWGAVACAAMLAGWTSFSIEAPAGLAAAVRGMRQSEPVRGVRPERLVFLISAAAAKAGDRDLADALVAGLPAVMDDVDQTVFRLAYLTARGRVRDATDVRDRLLQSPGGRRALRSYHRLIESS